jgi:tRNA1(Val) A37 N6-methylase TrmN6
MGQAIQHYLLGHQNIKILQDPDFLQFSLDSILVADFLRITQKIQSIIDLGTGVAPVPLFLSTKTSVPITGIDIQSRLIELAIENARLNHLESQLTFLNVDINEVARHFKAQSFDAVIANPPFFKVSEQSPLNEKEEKTMMRHETKLTLKGLIKNAAYLLKNQGTFTFIHRAQRLPEIILELEHHQMTVKRLRFVHPKFAKDATSVLIEARFQGQQALEVLTPLYVHDETGEYSREVKKIFNFEEGS